MLCYRVHCVNDYKDVWNIHTILGAQICYRVHCVNDYNDEYDIHTIFVHIELHVYYIHHDKNSHNALDDVMLRALCFHTYFMGCMFVYIQVYVYRYSFTQSNFQASQHYIYIFHI